ncbi:MAG: fibronectin type III-like domain-contianing protein [Candidatus Sulfotelmatobacter sp.]
MLQEAEVNALIKPSPVVQLYVKHLKSKVERPVEELKGFQRVTLKPNETKTVQISLKACLLGREAESVQG